ncbi:MAG: N-acetylglucosaminyldiphosphoundecaprenol N-acetyl-beta-D-mannosaminyltransferase [Vicingaceae bacterium]|jgi:N-acetylglucosaminyldiphosphoundecaprenol N-acetyl-beta-D-mannosaminyltransferase
MKVLKTILYHKGFDSAVAESLELLQADCQNLIISPSDANVLVCARTNKKLNKIVSQFYWNLPDGMPSVWMLKLKGAKDATRISGYAFFEELMKRTATTSAQHFLCGGDVGVAEKLKAVCQKWGNNNVCGTLSPPYKDELNNFEIKEIAEEINKQNTTVLWVGLGAPKQLYFAHEIAKYTKAKLIVTIGAAFDFHAGTVQKAPSWIESSGMEWFYRLLKEPARLSKRYFKVVPKFIFYSILDR